MNFFDRFKKKFRLVRTEVVPFGRANSQRSMTKLIFVFAQFCERAKQAGSFTALTGAKQWRLVLPVQMTVGKVKSGRRKVAARGAFWVISRK